MGGADEDNEFCVLVFIWFGQIPTGVDGTAVSCCLLLSCCAVAGAGVVCLFCCAFVLWAFRTSCRWKYSRDFLVCFSSLRVLYLQCMLIVSRVLCFLCILACFLSKTLCVCQGYFSLQQLMDCVSSSVLCGCCTYSLHLLNRFSRLCFLCR